jgi:hypothetical protein
MNAIPMLLLVILVLIFIGSTLRHPLQQIRRLRRAAHGPIGTLPATGLVGVIGKVSGEELRSPLTGTPCVLWHVVVERYHNKRWRPVYQQASTEAILLDDGTGRVQVTPQAAELLLADDLRQARGLLSQINPEIELKLEELGVETRDLWGKFGYQLRVFERYIMADEQFSALGYIARTTGQSVLRAMPDTPLFLTDQNLDQVLRGLYRRVASTIGGMGLIAGSFSCCLLLQLLEPR